MATATELAEAKAALHALITGSSVASITKNGRSITFKTAEIGQLRAYIAELELDLGLRRRIHGARRVSL